jgi:O-antigen/teichoic acid export membrane protein
MTFFVDWLPPPVRNALRVARLRPFDTSTAAGRSDERYRRIVLSVGTSIVGRILISVASLLTIPLVIGHLGKEQYGLWAAINGFAPWIALVDLGITAALVNPLSEAHGRDDECAARGYLATALTMLFATAALVGLLVAVVFPHVDWATLFNASGTIPAGTVRLSSAIAIALFVATIPFGVVPQVFGAYQKSYVSSAIATAGALFALGLLVLGVRMDGSLPWLLAAQNGGGVIAGAGGLAYLLFRNMRSLRPLRGDVTKDSLRRILATSVPLYLFQIGGVLVNYSQQLIVAARVDLATVAEYDLLFKIYLVVMGLIALSTSSFAPTFREAFERGDLAWMRRSFWHLVRVRVAAAAAACFVILIGGNTLLRLWLHRTDFQFGLAVWLTLACLVLAVAWAASFLEFLTVLDKIWPLVLVAIGQGALTILLSWTLSPRMGVLGAMLAITVPAISISGWILPWLAWHLLRERKPA